MLKLVKSVMFEGYVLVAESEQDAIKLNEIIAAHGETQASKTTDKAFEECDEPWIRGFKEREAKAHEESAND